MTRSLAFLLLFASASPARAYFDASFTQTFGANDYRGTRVWADFGDEWHLKPMFSLYRSDLSNGTYKTFSARVARDTKQWGAGFTAGGSPKTSGYSNGFLGGDVSFTFTPGGDRAVRRIPGSPEGKAPKGKGLARVDVGAALLHTRHHDEFQAPVGTFQHRRGQRLRPTALTIGQTDFTLNSGVSVLGTLLSAEYTVSRYNKDLDAVSANPAAVTRIPGLISIIQGFPKTSFNAQVELGMLPIVDPYLSVTRTTFKTSGVPASTAVTIGATAGFEMLEAHGSYERYFPGGGAAAQNYVGIGAGVRF